MQRIDVLKKLQEIQNRSPEELGRAIDSINKLNAIAPSEQKVAEAKTTMPSTSNGSYMVDVLSKLKEISDRSPEIAHAIDNANRMGNPVSEGIEIKTSGNDAVLAQILKLAGMVGGVNSPYMADAHGDEDMEILSNIEAEMGQEIPQDHTMAPLPSVGANLPSIDGGPSMDVDMGMDKEIPVQVSAPETIEDAAERPYTNSPHEMTKPMSAAVPKGNDLARPKATFPKVAGGDNPTHVAVSFT